MRYRSANSILEGIKEAVSSLEYSSQTGGDREHAFQLHVDVLRLEAIEEMLLEMCYAIQDEGA